jgi:hypothetical protein
MKMLIVCEGEKTEPNYFRALINDVPNSTIFTEIIGKGTSCCRLIRETIKIRNDYANDEESPLLFDEVWAVFDKDDNEDFNKAINFARENNIKCAWSNESFELWYCLHFQFVSTNNGRSWYIHKINRMVRKLTGNVHFKYKKNSTDFYGILQKYGDETKAIKWAELLDNRYADINYAHHSPCTTVYTLVKRLRELKD